MKYRSDRDSLGSVKITSDAFYGPFTARALNQYHVTGQTAHPNLIKSFVMIKRSAAVANMKTKVINRKQGTAIVKACEKILTGKYVDQFVVAAEQGGLVYDGECHVQVVRCMQTVRAVQVQKIVCHHFDFLGIVHNLDAALQVSLYSLCNFLNSNSWRDCVKLC